MFPKHAPSRTPSPDPRALHEKQKKEIDASDSLGAFGLEGVSVSMDDLRALVEELGLAGQDAKDLVNDLAGDAPTETREEKKEEPKEATQKLEIKKEPKEPLETKEVQPTTPIVKTEEAKKEGAKDDVKVEPDVKQEPKEEVPAPVVAKKEEVVETAAKVEPKATPPVVKTVKPEPDVEQKESVSVPEPAPVVSAEPVELEVKAEVVETVEEPHTPVPKIKLQADDASSMHTIVKSEDSHRESSDTLARMVMPPRLIPVVAPEAEIAQFQQIELAPYEIPLPPSMPTSPIYEVKGREGSFVSSVSGLFPSFSPATTPYSLCRSRNL